MMVKWPRPEVNPDQGEEKKTFRGWSDPGKRQGQAHDQRSHEQDAKQRVDRILFPGDHPGEDLVRRVTQGEAQRQQCGRSEQATARPDDDQDAGESEQHGDPAQRADSFAEKKHRQQRQQDGMNETDGLRLGNRHRAVSDDDEDGACGEQHSAQQLHGGEIGTQHAVPATGQEDHQQEHEGHRIAGPDDHRHRVVASLILRQRIGRSVGDGRQKRHRDTAPVRRMTG